jgi:uncharacterized membrane protein
MRDTHALIPQETSTVSTLVLLVLVLLGLAFVLVPGALAYLAYRHPAARGPLAVGIATVAAMAAIIIPIGVR